MDVSGIRDTVGATDYFSGDLFFKYDFADSTAPRFSHPVRIDGYIVGLVGRGSVTVGVDLDSYRAVSRSLVVIPSDRVVQITSRSADLEGRLLVFSRHFLSELKVDIHKVVPVLLRSRPCVELAEGEFASVENFFDLMLETVRSDDPSYREEILAGLITASFYRLCAILNRHRPLPKPHRSRSEEYFERFLALLTEHHREQHSPAFYAGQMNITSKYLSAVVKSVSGKTVSRWIDEFIILEAKTMLRYSGMSVQQVAYALNFSSQSFFGKYFKQHTGFSPRQYKSQE